MIWTILLNVVFKLSLDNLDLTTFIVEMCLKNGDTVIGGCYCLETAQLTSRDALDFGQLFKRRISTFTQSRVGVFYSR